MEIPAFNCDENLDPVIKFDAYPDTSFQNHTDPCESGPGSEPLFLGTLVPFAPGQVKSQE